MREKQVKDLLPSDMVDLEGDIFADPDSNRIEFECEYAVVESIKRETSDCIAVWFEGIDCFGFPPEHIVRCAE